MLTHPIGHASYAVPVRQYPAAGRDSLAYFSAWIAPNHLAPAQAGLMLRGVTPAHKRLEKLWLLISKNYIYH